MRLPLYEPPDRDVLWRVNAHGRERVPPGRGYWFDNTGRPPAGLVVAQATLAGQMVYRDAAGEHPVGPGQVVVFVYGERSSYGLADPQRERRAYRCQWVNLQGAGLVEHADALRRQHGPVIDAGLRSPALAEMDELARLASPTSQAPARHVAEAVHRFVMRLFEVAEQSRERTMSPAQRAAQQIIRRPTQAWALKELAAQHGCSREHLSRVFHDQTGRTPAAYIAEARLQRARQLIEQTELPITAIAAQSGFTNAHTLARQVRHATGQSPTALRDTTKRRSD